MKYWNTNDENLARRLTAEFAGTMATFETSHDGGVAVHFHGRFVGLWIEFQRNHFSFVPAGYLQPTRSCLPFDRVPGVTQQLLAQAPAERQIA